MRNAEFHRTRKRLCQRRAQTKKTNAPEGSASACRMKKKTGNLYCDKENARNLSSTLELSRALELSGSQALAYTQKPHEGYAGG